MGKMMLPSCPDIEKGVISTFMMSNKKWIAYAYMVNPEYFYSSLHKNIVSFMLSANCTDAKIIVEKFPKNKGEILEIQTEHFSGTNVVAELEVLRDRYERRKIITSSSEATESAYSNYDKSSSEIVEKAIAGISSTISYSSKPESMSEILPRYFSNLSSPDGGGKIKTGLTDVDKMISGFAPGEMIILAARPSMGKTLLALQIARECSIKNSIPVLIFSIETSKDIICGRIITSEAGVSMDSVEAKNKQSLVAIGQHATAVSDAPIFIDDTAAISVSQIENKSESYVKNEGVKLIIIDHVGLVKNHTKANNRHEYLSEISKSIKALGKRLNVPTLTLCQLSREVEKRKPPIPILSDLRESGSFEEDADKVILLYREEYYNRKTDKKNICATIIAKNKNGRTGYREVTADMSTMNFKNKAEPESSEAWQNEY